ncbi:MAG: GAF domain-containing protein [Anaerolineae bacterium]|nr:GAF domain-containing protein [Anaerolineae bacterium]
MASAQSSHSDWERLHRQIEAFREHISLFAQRKPSNSLDSDSIWNDLLSSIEELEVAEEELRQQSDELVQARLQAEREQARYQELFEFAPEGYLVTDPSSLIQEANIAAANLLNVEPGFVVGKPLAIYIHENERREFRRRLRAAAHTAGTIAWDTKVVPRKQDAIDISITLAPIRGDSYALVGIRWQLRNITDHKQMEASITQLNEALEHRVEQRTQHLNEALLREQDARSQVEHIATQLAQLQRITSDLSEALTQQQVAEVTASRMMLSMQANSATVVLLMPDQLHLELIYANGISVEARQAWQRFPVITSNMLADSVRNAASLWFSSREQLLEDYSHIASELGSSAAWISVPLIVNQQPIGAIGLAFNDQHEFSAEDRLFVSAIANQCAQAIARALIYHAEQTARAEAEQANLTKIRFLGMVSHELRTPLASIKGFSTSLLAQDVRWSPEDQRAFLEIIDDESDKLTELIDQLLDLSRMESGTLPVAPEPRTVTEIINEVKAELLTFTGQHALHIDVPANLPPVRADIRRIAQVLINLVDNAAKYSPPGKVINITAHLEGGFVQVDVADQGGGIPPEHRENLFSAFQRSVSQDTNQKRGAGLGLAICKGIINLHGGRIWIQEHTGDGATLSFTLPLVTNLTAQASSNSSLILHPIPPITTD